MADLPVTAPKPVTQTEVEKAVALAQGGQEADKPADQQPAKPKDAPAPKEAAKADAAPAKPEAKPDAEPMGDDESLPTDPDALLKPMTLKSFMRRVSSMTRANLRKYFGTDDVEAIVAERKELDEFRAKKVEDEKAKLTEVERLKLEKKDADDRAAKAEQRADARVQKAVAKEVESDLKSHVRGLVDRDDVEDFLDKLARAAADPDNGIKSVRQLKEYADRYVEKHPKWKKAEAKPDAKPSDKPDAKPSDKRESKSDKKPKEETPAPRKVPIHNGGRRVTDARPQASKEGEVPLLGKLSKDELFKQSGLKL
jgi:hypothetical protein